MTTLETVIADTPAALATSWIVATLTPARCRPPPRCPRRDDRGAAPWAGTSTVRCRLVVRDRRTAPQLPDPVAGTGAERAERHLVAAGRVGQGEHGGVAGTAVGVAGRPQHQVVLPQHPAVAGAVPQHGQRLVAGEEFDGLGRTARQVAARHQRPGPQNLTRQGSARPFSRRSRTIGLSRARGTYSIHGARGSHRAMNSRVP
ncbi:hypothetical protein ACQ4WX_08185 [Streptomyces lasalocidi]